MPIWSPESRNEPYIDGKVADPGRAARVAKEIREALNGATFGPVGWIYPRFGQNHDEWKKAIK
jgi:hypothetical protein